jgi:hypothetical protein
MSKCEFVFETGPGPIFATTQATLRCKTHNCSIMGTPTATLSEFQMCIIGRLEMLEIRVAQLEQPQSNIPTDELGNPFSLRKPAR